MENNANSLKKTTRLDGLLYLFLVITGVYGIMCQHKLLLAAGSRRTGPQGRRGTLFPDLSSRRRRTVEIVSS
jgi:hypothetical protein